MLFSKIQISQSSDIIYMEFTDSVVLIKSNTTLIYAKIPLHTTEGIFVDSSFPQPLNFIVDKLTKVCYNVRSTLTTKEPQRKHRKMDSFKYIKSNERNKL